MSNARRLLDVKLEDVVSLHVVGHTFHPQPGTLDVLPEQGVVRFVDSVQQGIGAEQVWTVVHLDAVTGATLREAAMRMLGYLPEPTKEKHDG